MGDCFVSGADFAFFSDAIANWLAYGIGLGVIAWLIGQVVALIWSVVRY